MPVVKRLHAIVFELSACRQRDAVPSVFPDVHLCNHWHRRWGVFVGRGRQSCYDCIIPRIPYRVNPLWVNSRVIAEARINVLSESSLEWIPAFAGMTGLLVPVSYTHLRAHETGR